MPSPIVQSVVVVGTTALTALASLVTVMAFLRSSRHDVSDRTLKRFRRVTNSDALPSKKTYFEAEVQHQECYEYARMLVRDDWRYPVGQLLNTAAFIVTAAVYCAPVYLWFKADQRRALFGWFTEQSNRVSSGDYLGLFGPQIPLFLLCDFAVMILLLSSTNYLSWSLVVTGNTVKLDRPQTLFKIGMFEVFIMTFRLASHFIGTRAYLRTVVAMKRAPMPYTDPEVYLLDEDFRRRFLIEYEYELDIRRRVYRRLSAKTKAAIVVRRGFVGPAALLRRKERLERLARAKSAYLISAARLEDSREAYAHLMLGRDRRAHGRAALTRGTRR